jgi:A/G-specific adenine glycosylase
LVDGNVERVLSRLFAFEEDLATSQGRKGIWRIVAALVQTEDPGTFNQGLMELGALVCLPSAPRCLLCQLSSLCEGYQKGIADRLPIKIKEKRSIKVQEVVLLLENQGKWLLTDANEESLFPGLWQFPWVWKKRGERFPRETLAALLERLGLAGLPATQFHELKHGITFRSISSTFYLAEAKGRRVTIASSESSRFRWVATRDLMGEALPAYQKKVIEMLSGR